MVRKKVCRKFGCGDQSLPNGLCAKHDEESQRRHQRSMDTADSLHRSVIDGVYIGSGLLGDEFRRVQDWWNAICSAERAGREHPVLKDETRFGVDWCTAIAVELIDAIRDERMGKEGDNEIRRATRQWTWDRFENLERAFMSNGVLRPEKAIR